MSAPAAAGFAGVLCALDYIKALCDAVDITALGLQRSFTNSGAAGSALLANASDWRLISTLLALAKDQATAAEGIVHQLEQPDAA